MAAPIGFSVGDLIAGINLIIISVRAVRDGGGAVAEYQAISEELESLKAGLQAVDDLCLHEATPQLQTSIHEAVQRTQRCIEDFIKKNTKYQPWLRPDRRGWKTNLNRIKWTLCRKDDLVKFRSQLERHSSSTNTLLAVVLVRQSLAIHQGQQTIQKSSFDMQTQLGLITKLTNKLSKQQADLLQQQLSPEVRGSDSAVNSQPTLRQHQEIPRGVMLQNPVVMLDACGRVSAFHLDFIDSKDAFIAVLKVKFKQYGVSEDGLRKLDRSEFAVCSRQKYLSMSRPWQAIFKPGQSVDMSMIFHRPTPRDSCPSCGYENPCQENSDTDW